MYENEGLGKGIYQRGKNEIVLAGSEGKKERTRSGGQRSNDIPRFLCGGFGGLQVSFKAPDADCPIFAAGGEKAPIRAPADHQCRRREVVNAK